jgi:hypothetical protein
MSFVVDGKGYICSGDVLRTPARPISPISGNMIPSPTPGFPRRLSLAWAAPKASGSMGLRADLWVPAAIVQPSLAISGNTHSPAIPGAVYRMWEEAPVIRPVFSGSVITYTWPVEPQGSMGKKIFGRFIYDVEL